MGDDLIRNFGHQILAPAVGEERDLVAVGFFRRFVGLRDKQPVVGADDSTLGLA